MEDVVEIRIEYEPTPQPVEDDPKAQGHGVHAKADSEQPKQTPANEAAERTIAAESGPACAMWVESPPRGDERAPPPPLVPQEGVAERAVDTRKSVAFFAVFDGHGGREAAHFARDNLWDLLKKQRGFWSKDHGEVCAALRKGFVACHHAMWKELRKSLGVELNCVFVPSCPPLAPS